MKGHTDVPRFLSQNCAMNAVTETLEEYMTRRTAVRAELTADEGTTEDFLREALGVRPISAPPKSMLYTPDFMFKRQGE